MKLMKLPTSLSLSLSRIVSTAHKLCVCLCFQDADLIEILWKQDVDLGIPLEDYRPCNAPAAQPVATASPPPKSVEGSTVVPVLEKLESKVRFLIDMYNAVLSFFYFSSRLFFQRHNLIYVNQLLQNN